MSHASEDGRPEAPRAPTEAPLEAILGGAGWRSACGVGGWAALAPLLASLATMVVLFTVGGPPETAQEPFALLRDHRIEGLFRLELFSRTTAWVGLTTQRLDLTQIVLGLFVPAVKVAIMMAAGRVTET